MADGNNKLNAELRKVEDDLFAAEDFSGKAPVPLDDVLKPLPVPDEDLNPVAAGFVPVREDFSRAVPDEPHSAPAIRTFSESRPPAKHDVFSEPVKSAEPLPADSASAEEPLPVPEEPAVSVSRPLEEMPAPVPEPSSAPPVSPAPVRESGAVPAPRNPVPHRQIAVPDMEHASLGTILRQARNTAGLTAEQAADVTKIRLDYIVGIENDDFKRLPPVVFIRAYSRTLAMLYKLDQAALDAVMRRVDELEPPADVPRQLLQKLERDVQVSEEETKKLKRMILYAGLAVALIISLTVACIVAAAVGRARNTAETVPVVSAQTVPAVQTADLEKLLPQQVPEVRVLEVPVK